MSIVSKSAFLKPLRGVSERYPLPEYGAEAYVVIRALTSRDIMVMQELYGRGPDSGNLAFVHELFFRCLVDDDGNPIFESAVDVGGHLNLSIPALENLVKACLRVSGMDSKEGEEKN